MCQIVRVIRQQVPRGWNDVPVVGNVDLRFNGLSPGMFSEVLLTPLAEVTRQLLLNKHS